MADGTSHRVEGERIYLPFGDLDHQEVRIETATALLRQFWATDRRRFSRALAEVISGSSADDTP